MYIVAMYVLENEAFGCVFELYKVNCVNNIKIGQLVLFPILFSMFTVSFLEETWSVSFVIFVTSLERVSVSEFVCTFAMFDSFNPFAFIAKIRKYFGFGIAHFLLIFCYIGCICETRKETMFCILKNSVFLQREKR